MDQPLIKLQKKCWPPVRASFLSLSTPSTISRSKQKVSAHSPACHPEAAKRASLVLSKRRSSFTLNVAPLSWHHLPQDHKFYPFKRDPRKSEAATEPLYHPREPGREPVVQSVSTMAARYPPSLALSLLCLVAVLLAAATAAAPTVQGVSAERLFDQIEALGELSDTTPPSITRVLYTENDVRARDYVKGLMRDAGLEVREDSVGNIFGRLAGEDDSLPPSSAARTRTRFRTRASTTASSGSSARSRRCGRSGSPASPPGDRSRLSCLPARSPRGSA